LYNKAMQSHNGEATLNRDDEKYREGIDRIIDWEKNKNYTGREVPKKDLPSGIRCRIIYAKKD